MFSAQTCSIRAAAAQSFALRHRYGELAMKRHVTFALVISAAWGGMAAWGGIDATAQPAANPIEAHLAAAKAAAGFDFPGLLARNCIAPQTAEGPDVAPPPPPDRASWYTEPGKVFDNLYFVGTKFHSAWAMTSREGIILLDSCTITPLRSRSSAD